jgi:hypothetical protein
LTFPYNKLYRAIASSQPAVDTLEWGNWIQSVATMLQYFWEEICNSSLKTNPRTIHLLGKLTCTGLWMESWWNPYWASGNIILSSVVVTDSRKNVVSLLPLSLDCAKTFEAICEGIDLETRYAHL